MPGWTVKWTMTIKYSNSDIRKYQWVVNKNGESAFVWFYIGSGW